MRVFLAIDDSDDARAASESLAESPLPEPMTLLVVSVVTLPHAVLDVAPIRAFNEALRQQGRRFVDDARALLAPRFGDAEGWVLAARDWLLTFPLPKSATIRVLAVATLPPTPPPDFGTLPELRRGITDRARMIARATRNVLVNRWADVEERVAEGDARAEIVRVAEEWRADLLVVGARGLTPLTRAVLGSVSTPFAGLLMGTAQTRGETARARIDPHAGRLRRRAPRSVQEAGREHRQRDRGIIASQAEQALELAAVEADDDLIADDDHGHGRPACSRQELRPGRRILGDVLRLERHAFLRKKLFREVAASSASCPVHRDRPIRHHRSLSAWVIASRPTDGGRHRPPRRDSPFVRDAAPSSAIRRDARPSKRS